MIKTSYNNTLEELILACEILYPNGGIRIENNSIVVLDENIASAKTQLEINNAINSNKRNSYKQKIAEKRWEIENGGVNVFLNDGRAFKIYTDSVTQSKLTGALIAAQSGAITSVDWKTVNSGFQNLSAPQLQSVWGQVLLHVQNCFAREKELLEILNNKSNEELHDMDSLIENFW